MILIVFQLLLLLVTCLGWGYWLKCLRPAKHTARFGWYFEALGGLAVSVVLTLTFVYLNVPVKYTAWPILAGALGGCLGHLRWILTPERSAGFPRADAAAVAALFFGCFAAQGGGLFVHGPANYYGNAHTDQLNYTLLAQFLLQEPPARPLAEVGLHPWMIKGIDNQVNRMGQSAAHAYLAAVSFSDAKSSYGVLSVFFAALLPASVYVLLRLLHVPYWTAVLGAAWCGLLPVVARIHLDGFLSQTSILFVTPTLAAAYLDHRRLLRRAVVSVTLLLAFLLVCYTEMFVIGAFFLGLLAVADTARPWKDRMEVVVLPFLGAQLLNPVYIVRAIRYVMSQYGVAGINVAQLTVLVPHSGSLLGWSEIFAQPPGVTPLLYRLQTLAGLFIFSLCVSAFFTRSLHRRLLLAAMAAAPLAALAVLASNPVFAVYPFSKIAETFAPIWVMLAVLGLLRLAMALPSVSWRLRLRAVNVILCMMVMGAAAGTAVNIRGVTQNRGNLTAINSESARRMYAFLEANPDKTYLANEPNPILSGWLLYHARRAKVYVATGFAADRPISPEQFECARPPEQAAGIWLVNGDGTRMVGGASDPPVLEVENPQGQDRDGTKVWYWVGERMGILVKRFATPAEADYTLSMRLLAGPANPAPERVVGFKLDQQEERVVRFSGSAPATIPLRLNGRINRIEVRVISPTEHTVKIPGDSRKHMVRLEGLSLKPAEVPVPVPAPPPARPKAKAAAAGVGARD